VLLRCTAAKNVLFACGWLREVAGCRAGGPVPQRVSPHRGAEHPLLCSPAPCFANTGLAGCGMAPWAAILPPPRQIRSHAPGAELLGDPLGLLDKGQGEDTEQPASRARCAHPWALNAKGETVPTSDRPPCCVMSPGPADPRLPPVSCSLTSGKALCFGFKSLAAGDGSRNTGKAASQLSAWQK